MSHGVDQESQAMMQAIQLMRENRAAEAETLLLKATREAQSQHGIESCECASAFNDLGNFHALIGNMRQAAAEYRNACSGPLPQETQARRERLSFLVNLATALEATGELDEAEQVYRQGLAGRAEFYGVDHAGYAFGLEPLACLLIRQGKYEEGLNTATAAVDNFLNNSHPRVANALAVRAEAMKALGLHEPAFAGLEDFPDNVITDLANAVLQRRERTHPILSRLVLAELLPLIETRFGQDQQITLNVLATIVNHETEMGEDCNHGIRLSAIKLTLEALKRKGNKHEIVHALQGLALALANAGQEKESLLAYEEAIALAIETNEPAIVAQVRRNYGLELAELKRHGEAEHQLRLAVKDAERSGNAEMWGRAETSLGIMLMHQCKSQEATPLLQSALKRLEPSHPDTIYARYHLKALHSGKDCCSAGDGWEALAEQLREYILEQVPENLLQDIKLHMDGAEDIKVEVQLAREPSQDEVESLEIIINQAVYAFKARIGRHS